LDDIEQHRYVALSLRAFLRGNRLLTSSGECALAPAIADRWPAWRANHPN
jgi:hypothetical protein